MKHGVTIHSRESDHSRHNKVLIEVAEQKYLRVPIAKVVARAAEYCSVLVPTVYCIRNKSKNCM
jgi:hypothetical protein